MPVTGALHVEGLDELRRALRYVGDRGLLDALQAANQDAAERVENAALPTTPFRTGRLRRSLQPSATPRSGRVKINVPYAMAVHWGRKRGNVGRPPGNYIGSNRIIGRPFLWEAAKHEIPRIEPEYRDEILRIIAIAVRRYA